MTPEDTGNTPIEPEVTPEPAVEPDMSDDARLERAVALLRDSPEDPPSEPEPAPEPTPEPEPTPSPEEPPIPSTQLSALLRRDRKQREEILAQRAEFEAEKQEWKERLEAFENAKRMAIEDPVALMQSLGVTRMADAAKMLYYKEVNQNVPQDVQIRNQQTSLRSEVSQLRSQVEEYQKKEEERRLQQEQQQYVDNYKSQLRSYFSEIPEEMTHIRSLAKNAPEELVDGLIQTAVHIAQQNPGGPPPEPASVVSRYHENIKKELAKLGVTIDTPTEPAEESKSQTKTLSSKSTTKTSRVPPDKLSEEERLKRAQETLKWTD